MNVEAMSGILGINVNESVPVERLERVRSSAEWLVRSWAACGKTGAAAYYSWLRIGGARGRWAAPYPETTGYIIPTLIACSRALEDGRYIDIALRMADWLLALQYEDGAFPGGHHVGHPQPPSSFNTAQIAKGLLDAYRISGSRRYLESALRAISWLAEIQDEDGGWRRHSLRPGFSPSYYSEICWAMLCLWHVTGDERIRAKAIQGLTFIKKRQKPSGVIAGWGFKDNRRAFTHTIGYTIRGLLESGVLLGGQGASIWECGLLAARSLQRVYQAHGVLAGEYTEELRPSGSFICVTGNCQIALCWRLIYDKTGIPAFAGAADSALGQVIGCQVMASGKDNAGGLPGSQPLWGRYMRCKYPNWAVKYYIDALLGVARYGDGSRPTGSLQWV